MPIQPDASKKIDAYIAKAQAFAQPIGRKLRELIQKAHADIVEDWKWGAPNFHKDGMVCGLGAFKQHVTRLGRSPT